MSWKGKLSKAKARGKEHIIRGRGLNCAEPGNMRIENGMKVRNFGIFKEIAGYLESLLEICAKLQLATLKNAFPFVFSELNVMTYTANVIYDLSFLFVILGIICIGNYTVREVLMKNRTRVWRNVYNTASA